MSLWISLPIELQYQGIEILIRNTNYSMGSSRLWAVQENGDWFRFVHAVVFFELQTWKLVIKWAKVSLTALRQQWKRSKASKIRRPDTLVTLNHFVVGSCFVFHIVSSWDRWLIGLTTTSGAQGQQKLLLPRNHYVNLLSSYFFSLLNCFASGLVHLQCSGQKLKARKN